MSAKSIMVDNRLGKASELWAFREPELARTANRSHSVRVCLKG